MKHSNINFARTKVDDFNEFQFQRFALMGEAYPHALEDKYKRILIKIDQAWEDDDAIEQVLSELIIDRRGGRQGFPIDVLNDIIRLKEFLNSEKIRLSELKIQSAQRLEARGLALNDSDFLKVLEAGDQEALDMYVNAGFKFQHLYDSKGSTPLMVALKKGFTVCASILLNAGDNPNAKDRMGLTPLLISCGKPTKGYRLITEKLVKLGANVNVRDPLGNTPLLLALSGGMLDIALLLLHYGADIHAVNKSGENYLMLLDEVLNKEDVNFYEIQTWLLQHEKTDSSETS